MNNGMTCHLSEVGWDDHWEQEFEKWFSDSGDPARVLRQDRNQYLVLTKEGERVAHLRGRLIHRSGGGGSLPAVGDWVCYQGRPTESRGDISGVIPRRTHISRQSSGEETRQQILAANVDTAFLVGALDGGRGESVRRLERLAVLARGGGVQPVAVLNKSDLADDPDRQAARVEAALLDIPTIPVSGACGTGLRALAPYLQAGVTSVFLGPSGVGKSTLINALLGQQRQETGTVRAGDRKGRHTTTARELIVLPGGGLVIDTPGIREVALWAEGDDVASVFDEFENLARSCKYRDCRHESEPGCAIRKALEDGRIDSGRYENYLELRRETAYLDDRRGYLAQKEERFKKIGKWYREVVKWNPKRR